MDIKNLALISPILLLTTLGASRPGNVSSDKIKITYSSTLGPYNGNEGLDTLNITYTYPSEITANVYEEVKVRNYEGVLVSIQESPRHPIKLTNEVSFEIPTFPIKYGNMEVEFNIYQVRNTYNTRVYSKSSILKPKQEEVTLGFSDAGAILCYPMIGANFEVDAPCLVDEVFTLYYFPSSFYYVNSYQVLSLGRFQIVYEFYGKEFQYQEAYLTFKDPKNLFPYIDTVTGEDYKRIDLTMAYGTIWAAVYKTMYVHPKTLEMSLIPRDGFIETNTFFLPHNRVNDVDKMVFNFHLIGAGHNNTNFNFPVRYDAIRPFFGSDSSSQYWLEGGIDYD